MQDSFGMMEGAFFVSRIDLLGWINDLLQLNLTKIEQLGTGAVYCQILDVCFPGKVAMNRVNWRAKHEYEFLGNFKILQLAFSQLGIKKQIEVEKLSKAKYQDNLEFGQWMKRFYELKFGQDAKKDYNAKERRGFVAPEFAAVKKGVSPKPSHVFQNKEITKASKEDRALEKKIKINQNTSIAIQSNATKKGEIDPSNTESLLKEREELNQRLRFIQQLVSSNRESDEQLLRKVRDFIGIIAQKQESPSIYQSSYLKQGSDSILQDDNSLFLTGSPQEEFSLLIEGESL